jgi:pimeloyl-ACP methyl ester carboxylesterase
MTVATLRRAATVGTDVVAGVRRTACYVQQAGHATDGSAWTGARLGAAAAVDELLLTTFQIARSPEDRHAFASHLDEGRALVEFLRGAPDLADPIRYHRRPAPALFAGRERHVGHIDYLHARFPSAYVPPLYAPGAARFREETDNRVVHAWILARPEPAPWLVCVHGAGMGDPVADLFAFRAGAFHRAGFNVAIPVLPHHGPRGTGRLATAFPSDDPTRNFHGAAQAVSDVRSVLAAVERRGEPAMLVGISLGGYVAATVAALEPGVRGVVVGVPVVDLAELLRRHAPARFASHPLFDDLYDVSRTLGRYTCPVDLPVPSTTTRRIWAGRADRLVHPDQVERLVAHWAVAAPYWYTGGHVGFLGLPSVLRYTRDAAVDAGLATTAGGRFRARPVEPAAA